MHNFIVISILKELEKNHNCNQTKRAKSIMRINTSQGSVYVCRFLNFWGY